MSGERHLAQEALFYEFNLDRHVPADHLLRAIDRFVDLSRMRENLCEIDVRPWRERNHGTYLTARSTHARVFSFT